MTSLSAIRAFNEAALSPKTYLPVAVFLGGTSGIGQGLAEAFANHTKGNAHIVVVGRNQAAAEAIIAKFPKPTSTDAKHLFLKCDVASMTSVRGATSEILAKYPKINYVAMSPGFISLKGRVETEDGLDRKMAVHYYGRWLFAKSLIGALEKAKSEGEDARVLTVLAAGKGGNVDFDDLGLKKTFSVQKASVQAPAYNDLIIEEFAARHPTLTFTHSYPGFVLTSLFTTSDRDNVFIRFSKLIMYPVFSTFCLSVAESGEYQLYGMLNSKTGANRAGAKGQDIGKISYVGPKEDWKRLWDHSLEATGEKE